MNGRDLFAGMSFIDERFVEEAECKTIPKAPAKPWIKAASLAACLGLLLSGAFLLNPLRSPPKAAGDIAGNTSNSVRPGEGPEMQKVETHAASSEDAPTGEVRSVILRVDAVTDQGFTGTVAELVDSGLLQIGMELNVVVPDGVSEIAPDGSSAIEDQKNDSIGIYVIVWFPEYDEETNTIVVSALEKTAQPTKKP